MEKQQVRSPHTMQRVGGCRRATGTFCKCVAALFSARSCWKVCVGLGSCELARQRRTWNIWPGYRIRRQLTPASPVGGLFFSLSECQDQSAATQFAAPASSSPSASHRRGRGRARKRREMGADGSLCLWVKTNISFFIVWIGLVLCLLSVTTSRERDVLWLTRMKNRIHLALPEAAV